MLYSEQNTSDLQKTLLFYSDNNVDTDTDSEIIFIPIKTNKCDYYIKYLLCIIFIIIVLIFIGMYFYIY